MRRILHLAFILPFIALFTTGCDEDSSPTDPSDPDVSAPTNLRAVSDHGKVGLMWTASTSINQSNFGSYRITAVNKNTGVSTSFDVPKNATEGGITNLNNGTRFQFTIHSVTTQGKLSKDSSTIEWSAAVRHTNDMSGLPIRVYATTSTLFPSALDMHNDNMKAEVLPLLGAAFATRADLFVFAQNNTSVDLEIKSPHLSTVNPGLVTEFSNVPSVNVDSLNQDYSTTPPATSTYILPSIKVSDALVNTGRIVYGRLKRGNDLYYFRLLIRKGVDGRLVQGSGPDRYLEFEVSFQDVRNVPFAKR